MGKRTARGLLVLLALFLLTPAAKAGVTYDFAFRSTDINGNPIAGGSVVGGGKSFSFDSPSTVGANLVLDVILRTTDPLFAASVSVVYDDSNGLGVSFAQEWFGQGITFNMMGLPVLSFAPRGGLSCAGNACSSFDGVIIPPNGPPSLPVGTYNIGTIIWNTAGMTNNSALMTRVISGIDTTGGVVGGDKVDLTGTEVTTLGFIGLSLVPEPATAGLLLLGLAGMALASRRRA